MATKKTTKRRTTTSRTYKKHTTTPRKRTTKKTTNAVGSSSVAVGTQYCYQEKVSNINASRHFSSSCRLFLNFSAKKYKK